MAQLLVRDIDEALVNQLKEQAKEHHRSLQGQVKLILETHCHSQVKMDKVLKNLRAFHASFGDRKFSDSTEMIREDRNR